MIDILKIVHESKKHLRKLPVKVVDGIPGHNCFNQHYHRQCHFDEFRDNEKLIWAYDIRGYQPRRYSPSEIGSGYCFYDYEVNGFRSNIVDSLISDLEVAWGTNLSFDVRRSSERSRLSHYLALCYVRSPRFVRLLAQSFAGRRLYEICPHYELSEFYTAKNVQRISMDINSGLIGVIGCLLPAADYFERCELYAFKMNEELITSDSPFVYHRSGWLSLPLSPHRVLVALPEGNQLAAEMTAECLNKYRAIYADQYLYSRSKMNLDELRKQSNEKRNQSSRLTALDARLINNLVWPSTRDFIRWADLSESTV